MFGHLLLVGVKKCPRTALAVAELTWCFPTVVGSNYFCDIYSADNTGLLDGLDCGADSCCDYNSLPWFRVMLSPTSTMSNFEVRICTDKGFENERIFLEELAIYVQGNKRSYVL